ncbi:HK97 gp10 family phage protein [Veillonella intestinalis]|uniref:HK97 gp10 family phage protein n=1 Tax=Veillonella intestinalis TaxID=2941341 RepID=UPI00203E22A5|nr:HK97 gp10 family phage protein [Veillonella intestinalis]
MAEFKLLKIDELQDNIKKAISEHPKEAEKTLNKVGLELKKELTKESKKYASGREHKRSLAKSWHKKVVGDSLSNLEAQVWSTAPHVGLVDRGHKIVTKNGNTVGYVQGKHFIDKTSKDVGNDVLPAELEKYLKRLKKKIEG